ncbi:MAG: hypothetical protein PHS44_03585 [Candidatus Dojkabacteria bacterium]|jgi:hypothetical protein|nr:hypothetical protein [Candidatus Dojkabacteria bacterium]
MKGLFDEEKPIISIKEARKLLGSEYRDINNTTVQNLIDELDSLAKMIVERKLKRLQKS